MKTCFDGRCFFLLMKAVMLHLCWMQNRMKMKEACHLFYFSCSISLPNEILLSFSSFCQLNEKKKREGERTVWELTSHLMPGEETVNTHEENVGL